MNFETWFKDLHPEIPIPGAQAILRLTAEDATIPFIARYRKEQTGNLDEVAIKNVIEGKETYDQVIKRQAFILGEIEHQGKLTDALKEKISTTFRLELLEDLYLPYKQKRKSKATLAKEAGIGPLADWIWDCGHGTQKPEEGQTLELWAYTFHNDKLGFLDAAATLAGAQEILIERLTETQELREAVRIKYFRKGFIVTTKGSGAKPASKFENYFSYREAAHSLKRPENSHRYLALRRGWMEEELSLSIGGAHEEEPFDTDLLQLFESTACTVHDSVGAQLLAKAARLALKAHVIPSIENELHKALKEIADLAAIEVFSENVRKLLLAAPFGAKPVLGVDPGIRTGCKLAIVDETGKYIASAVIYLHTEAGKEKAKTVIPEVIKVGKISAVAVGNGTAGRETEQFFRDALKAVDIDVPVVMVNEAGASVYSASDVAREEFPELDATIRGAISIARRLQDPLAELVKIDPKSIGVGQYQHDLSPPALKRSLDFVVDSCVNRVGVDINTASPYLLSHVSGIGDGLARSIVQHRNEKGIFKNRNMLQEVARFSKKTFELAAGFLRVPQSENPLDNTGIHPERYSLIESLAERHKKSIPDLLGRGIGVLKSDPQFRAEAGEFTFDDILKELEKPGRDPRDSFVVFQFREDIHELKDLTPGMICPGIVTNVTNFGSFVDIGVHQDGLVHVSQMGDRGSKNPLSPGEHVRVKVLEVDLEKKQISLSMRQTAEHSRAQAHARADTRGSTRADTHVRNERSPRTAAAPRISPPAPRLAMPAAQVQPYNGPPIKITPRSEMKNDRPARGPRPAFTNNAFAALAALKKDLKK